MYPEEVNFFNDSQIEATCVRIFLVSMFCFIFCFLSENILLHKANITVISLVGQAFNIIYHSSHNIKVSSVIQMNLMTLKGVKFFC